MSRELEDIAWQDLGRLELGQAPSRARRVSSLLNDARIRSCSRQVLNRGMDMLHFLGSTSWHLNNTMTDMLGVADDADGRPASPIRGPPRVNPDSIRLAPENQRSSSLQDNVGFDADFMEFGNGATNRSNPQAGIDAADLYLDLMEDNNERGISSRGRGGRTGTRGGRQRRSTTSNRGTSRRPTRSLPASSQTVSSVTNDARHQVSVHPPPENLRPSDFSDGEELDENDELRRWRECIICNGRVGRYTMLGCGAFPVCGQCINRWFINLNHDNCPHCGGLNYGWLRLDL